MARNTTVIVGAEYVELTNADAVAITIQNKEAGILYIVGTTGPAPSDDSGAIELPGFTGILNEALADLFPGIAATRVFGRGAGKAFVSHA